MNTFLDTYMLFIEHQLCARYCFKYFKYMISFNSQNKPRRNRYCPHFIKQETGASIGYLTHAR